MHTSVLSFRARADVALTDPTLKLAIDRTTGTAERKRAAALAAFPQFDAAHLHDYLRLAADIRRAGFGVELYPEAKALGKQLKHADRRGFRVALIAGSEEWQSGKCQVKDLRDGSSVTVDRTDKRGNWLRIGEPTVWPWPWPPLVDAQNLPAPGQFWGRSDIDAVNIALTRAGNARASDLNRTARLHAHPSVLAKGMTPTQAAAIDLGNDKLTALPDPSMGLDYLELPEGASTSLGWLSELHDQFREHSRVPAVAAGRLDAAGALSGVALRILFAPLLQHTAQKRLTYGRLIRDLTRRLLALGGWQGTAVVQWPDILPTNDLEVWQTASAEQAAGVSRETSLRSRGLDPDQEEQNRTEEAARAANRMTEPYTDPAGDATLEDPAAVALEQQ